MGICHRIQSDDGTTLRNHVHDKVLIDRHGGRLLGNFGGYGGWHHNDAIAIAHHDISGKDRRFTAPDRHIYVDSLVQCQICRGRRPAVKRRDCQTRNVCAVSKSAIRHHASDTAHHQPAHQNAAGRSGPRITPAIHHENSTRRTCLNRFSLRMFGIMKDGKRIQILSRGNVSKGKGDPHHSAFERAERAYPLDGLIAKSALKKRRCDRSRACMPELRDDIRRDAGKIGRNRLSNQSNCGHFCHEYILERVA